MHKHLRLIYFFVKTELASHTQYRLGMVTWIINGAIAPLLMMFIWLVVSGNAALTLSQSQIISYYIITLLIARITQCWSIEDVGKEIRRGNFSSRLIKPYHYIDEEWGSTLGKKIVRLIPLIPLLSVLALIFNRSLSYRTDSESILLFLLSLILGIFVRFYLSNLLAVFTFWLNEYHSLEFLHNSFMEIFSGHLLPLALMPVVLRTVAEVSPFRFFISFPAEIAIGLASPEAIVSGFGVGIIYILGFRILYNYLLTAALKKFTAYGQ